MSQPDEKIQRLYLKLAQQLSERIARGDYPVGERLPSERDLAAQFGVSRPTVREAIIALEIAGLVDVRIGSGVYVQEQRASQAALLEVQGPGPFEILDARKLIEGETCALAAQHASEQQLQALQAVVDEMTEENRREAVTERADEHFHWLIAQAAGNSALAATVHWLWQLRSQSGISAHFQQRVRAEGIRPIVEDHQAIIDALVRRDAAAARIAMQAHLQRVADHLLEVMQP
ncbi:MAG: FadR family transcriptional regulator [Gammaproteobacteria bacterium]|nr:FadR family transcriptional regulator [Gammaproteobacteria bacterium]